MAPRVIVLDFDPTDPVQRRRRSKWRNEPTSEDGHVFDSQAERNRYRDLKALQMAGEISKLVVHPRYRLFVNGSEVGSYYADFRYVDAAGRQRVEDVKSPVSRTPVYRLKRRIVRAQFGIEVEEIE